MYSKLKSTICAQFAKKRSLCSTLSNSPFPERRQQDRRQRLNDRRNSQTWSGRARNERRRQDRRNPFTLLRINPLSHVESMRSQQTSPVDVTSQDTLQLCVVTKQQDLIERLRGYVEKSSVIDTSCYTLFHVAGISHDKLEAVDCDLILIDTAPIVLSALQQQLRTIRDIAPNCKIILLHDHCLPDLSREIIECRIVGLLPTNVSREFFVKAITTIHRGELWLPHQLISRIFDFYSAQYPYISSLLNCLDLTPSEQKIVTLLIKGLANKQIALQLSVSPETVKKHIKNIFRKTGSRNRVELITRYFSQTNMR